MKKFLLLLFISLSLPTYSQQSSNKLIYNSIINQIKTYPQSTLKDIYKNFFQDRFGPGHLLTDTAAANRYLREELNTRTQFQGAVYESTGYMGNFYRVNLSVIKEQVVDYDIFFSAFVRSLDKIEPVNITEWRKEWALINEIIAEMHLNLKNYEQDSLEIIQRLDVGKYVMHHSRTFNDNYDLHYRIIEKEIFENEILPIINIKIKE